MTDWATTRLVLTGPSSELLNFYFNCIRHQRFDRSGEEEFDFETIIPIPAEILTTFDDHSVPARELALKATGHPSAYEWCRENWGTKWNASASDVHSCRRDRFDMTFEPPWGCPKPVMQALAMQYPNLKGCVFSLNENADQGLVGKIANGAFTYSELEASRHMVFIVYRCTAESDISDPSAAALTSDWVDWDKPICSVKDASNFSAAAAACIKSAGPPGWSRAIDFEADLRNFLEAYDFGENAEDRMLLPANLEFLEDIDCSREEVERALMEELVSHLTDEAFYQDSPGKNFSDWRASARMLINCRRDSEFFASAGSTHQTGVVPDMSDIDMVKLRLTVYADQLWRRVLIHLTSNEHDHLPLPVDHLFHRGAELVALN